MKESKILDSSVWIAYLFDGKFEEQIESDEKLFLSALSLFEIKRKFIKKQIKEKDIESKIDFIKKRSIVFPIDAKIAERASELSAEKNLPSMDALIYATSLVNKLKLITLDNDFRGLSDVEILRIDED